MYKNRERIIAVGSPFSLMISVVQALLVSLSVAGMTCPGGACKGTDGGAILCSLALATLGRLHGITHTVLL